MLKTDFNNSRLTVYVCGELDHDYTVRLRSEIDAAVEGLRPKELWLDFSGVSFMDSSGVGLVMGRYRQMKLLGGRLRVVRISESLYRIFAMSGLEALGVLR